LSANLCVYGIPATGYIRLLYTYMLYNNAVMYI